MTGLQFTVVTAVFTFCAEQWEKRLLDEIKKIIITVDKMLMTHVWTQPIVASMSKTLRLFQYFPRFKWSSIVTRCPAVQSHSRIGRLVDKKIKWNWDFFVFNYECLGVRNLLLSEPVSQCKLHAIESITVRYGGARFPMDDLRKCWWKKANCWILLYLR